jgi:hypothetical protein
MSARNPSRISVGNARELLSEVVHDASAASSLTLKLSHDEIATPPTAITARVACAISTALIKLNCPSSALGLPQQIAESILDDGTEHHRVTSDRSREPPK